jgi:spore germination protein
MRSPKAHGLTLAAATIAATAGLSPMLARAAGPGTFARPPAHGVVTRAAGQSGRHLAVTGFQEEGDPNTRITASRRALSTVGLDGVNLSPDGSRVTTPDRGARRVLALAHSEHLRAEFLVSNWDNHINDFSEAYAHHLLAHPAHIKAVAASLATVVRRQGWEGVSVDLESLTGRDRAGLAGFLVALRADLPAGRSLSVCISNETSVAAYSEDGYDLPAIGRAVSQVVLMAYDQHGPWENTPGPVGSLTWQRKGLGVMLRWVPAAKIDLGVAGYGYDWRPHSNDLLSDAQARALVARDHGTKHFDAHIGEWVGHLPDGTTVWWSDARSYRLRTTLAKRDKLHGLAVWDLGLSDPLT